MIRRIHVGRPCPAPERQTKSQVLASVSPTLNDQTLYGRLATRAGEGKCKPSIGSTETLHGEYLIEDDSTDDAMSGSDLLDKEEDQIRDELYESVAQ